jgi:hypothetical protein
VKKNKVKESRSLICSAVRTGNIGDPYVDAEGKFKYRNRGGCSLSAMDLRGRSFSEDLRRYCEHYVLS